MVLKRSRNKVSFSWTRTIKSIYFFAKIAYIYFHVAEWFSSDSTLQFFLLFNFFLQNVILKHLIWRTIVSSARYVIFGENYIQKHGLQQSVLFSLVESDTSMYSDIVWITSFMCILLHRHDVPTQLISGCCIYGHVRAIMYVI